LAHAPEDAASGDWADGPSGDRLTAVIAIPAIDGRHVLAVVGLKRDRQIVLGERLMRSQRPPLPPLCAWGSSPDTFRRSGIWRMVNAPTGTDNKRVAIDADL